MIDLSSALSNKISSESIQEKWKERLFKADTNGDGKISKEEFKALMKHHKLNSGTVDLDLLFSELDTNNDGFIDDAEFQQFLAKQKGSFSQLLEQKMSNWGTAVQTGGDLSNILTSSQFGDDNMLLNMLGGVNASASASANAAVQQKWLDLLKKSDTDGDGKISKVEFKASRAGHIGKRHHPVDLDKMFAKMDTNGDGYIDETDYTQFSVNRETAMQKKLEQIILSMINSSGSAISLSGVLSNTGLPADNSNSTAVDNSLTDIVPEIVG